MAKIDPKLFSAHEQALHQAYETCPECGGELQVRHSKSGSFLGCSRYPDCDYKRQLSSAPQLEKVLEGSECPDCGSTLALKRGRYGLFVGCMNYPECQYIAKLDESDSTGITCPSCQKGQLVSRKSRYGKTFFACNGFPRCRYAVNFRPIAETCPDCGWGILVERKTSAGLRRECPQKQCQYKDSE